MEIEVVLFLLRHLITNLELSLILEGLKYEIQFENNVVINFIVNKLTRLLSNFIQLRST